MAFELRLGSEEESRNKRFQAQVGRLASQSRWSWAMGNGEEQRRLGASRAAPHGCQLKSEISLSAG